MTQASTPRSRITANRPWRSGASGVVRAVFTSTPRIRVPMVPTTAAGTPACSSPASASRVVVVLPWVPVTPIIRSAAVGSPYTAAERSPSARRGVVDDEGRNAVRQPRPGPCGSVSTATAPAASASPTKSMPWARAPGRAAYRSPGTDPLRAQRDAGDRGAAVPEDLGPARRGRRAGRAASRGWCAADGPGGSPPRDRRRPRREATARRCRPPGPTRPGGRRAWCRSGGRRSGAARSS